MNSCEVTIIDMDGPGIFEWAEENVQQRKSTDSKAPLLLTRNKGATGEVYVKVRTVDGTAKAGEHFEALDEDVFFKNNVTTKPVRVQLIKFDKPDDAGDDYSVSFFVDIAEADKDKAGGATLGNVTRVEVRIEYAEEDDGDEIMTFTDQFRQAMMVNGGEDGGEAGCVDMTMHYISITWKILAATVPPTHIWGGWATFWFSMSLVGIVTGIIGDIATVFGCIVGLDNEITGIFLVALGTSLPDTFASILAIKSDDNADNAVGNVTGSNSVNVFLGLGMPWLAATIYWAGVWTGGATGTAEKPGDCRSLDTCVGDENYARRKWLATYQGSTGAAYEDRPYDFRLLTRYVKDRNAIAASGQADFLPEYGGQGGFVVIGGKLGFNTFLFSVLCIVAFACLTISKCRIGHEAAGGPMGNKIIAGIYFTLWATFIIVGSINVTCDNCLNPFS
jgi:Ca2+/Na+ antiporter